MNHATKAPQPAPIDLVVADLHTFALEDDADRRTLRIALAVAVSLHIALLAVQLPQLLPELSATADRPKVYVVQQVRFKKPPPPPENPIPETKPTLVPVPDPTPDDPEPIRLPVEAQPTIDVPDSDLLVGIPEGPPPVESDAPLPVGGDVIEPLKLYAPPPLYTEPARKARIEGYVIVQAIIDKAGAVTNVRVVKGLPMGLDESAVEAVKRWRFEPATRNGKPVAVYYNLTINFRLQ
jgi:TonB family protein